jgi:hypothetical protein
MNVTQLLTKARALIKKGHCKYHYATNDEGREVMASAPDATHFCMLGAMRRICYDNNIEHPEWIGFVYQRFNKVHPNCGVSGWNDTHTKEEVLETLDKMIATK